MLQRSLFVSSLLVFASAACAQDYAIRALQGLGGATLAAGVNDRGDVVGSAAGSDGVAHGMVWSANGSSRDLGAGSEALKIDRLGNVVGSVRDANGKRQAALWRADGTFVALSNFGGDQSWANDINEQGQIVGTAWYGETRSVATLWDLDGAVTDLGGVITTPPFFNEAVAINDRGDLAGNYHYFFEGGRAMGHSDAWGTRDYWLDINPSGRTFGSANALNNAGTMVGVASNRAAIFDGTGGFTDMGNLFADVPEDERGGEAWDVNDAGAIVGNSWRLDDANSTIEFAAFVYGRDGMRRLDRLVEPSLGWTLTDAHGVNADGSVVGYGFLNGVQTAYVATPVPEPATLLALGAGAAGLLRRRRR